ncbi:MAG: hypothetical protein PQJ28_01040 [Spirochaetales bacterium]|nr:hypothetical protein [Spirochaetales bacterium]
MKKKSFTINAIVLLAGLFLAGSLWSCSSNKSKNNSTEKSDSREMMEGHSHSAAEEEDEHHYEGEKEGHHHDEMHEESSGEVSWVPSGKPFEGQLKLVKGEASGLNAQITEESGSNVLSIEPKSGEQAIMLLDGVFDNLGAELQFRPVNYTGQIAVLFHYHDESNYDAMVLDNQVMKLIRVENGNEKVLDSNEAQFPSDWGTLKISAAGEHLKCYLNGKQYNHGHAEELPAGKLGILVKGSGKILLKKIDVIPLEE